MDTPFGRKWKKESELKCLECLKCPKVKDLKKQFYY